MSRTSEAPESYLREMFGPYLAECIERSDAAEAEGDDDAAERWITRAVFAQDGYFLDDGDDEHLSGNHVLYERASFWGRVHSVEDGADPWDGAPIPPPESDDE